MTTATALAHPNIAFIKYRLAKLGRTNGKVCFGTGNINGSSVSFRDNRDRSDRSNIPSATPSQSQGDGVVTIPGVTQASQAVESAGAMKFRLSGDELPRLQTAPL